MNSIEIESTSKWFTKFSLSFLAIVGSINASLFIIAPLLPYKLAQYIIPGGLLTLIIAILFSFCFSFYWHRKEKKGLMNSEKYMSWLVTLLRYWMAFLSLDFGFQKLYEVNFSFSYHIKDSLVKTLTGTELTWNYYGYSYGLSAIVAIFQIAGGSLLLFRRTVLLGVVILLPVFFNIVLINVFYSIGLITLFTSLAIVFGLSYLVYQQKVDIMSFFKQYKSTLPSIGNTILKVSARIFCILIPCLFVMYYNHGVRLSEKYFGKWEVETMMRNGKLISEEAWETDDLAWKTIYFEEREKIYYCPNPHMYNDSTSILMKYIYDDKTNALSVVCYEKKPINPDTIPVQINQFDGKSMQWNMVLYNDTIHMKLKKVNS